MNSRLPPDRHTEARHFSYGLQLPDFRLRRAVFFQHSVVIVLAKWLRHVSTLALLCIVASYNSALAQAPDAGNYSAEQYDELIELRGQRVTMRDGVQLSVDIFRPDAAGQWPVLLRITPYNNGRRPDESRWYAKRGYVVVVADIRGRFDSDGQWDPHSPLHKTDGYDLVEWVAKQEWSTGRVGMIGGSYTGYTQWWTASQVPPALKAIVPVMAPPDQHWDGMPYQNGLIKSIFLDWSAGMAGRSAQTRADGKKGGFQTNRYEEHWHTPYIEINQARGLRDSPWFETFMRNNLSSSEYWQGISYQGKLNYQKMTVPALNITGWFDENQPGAPMNYIGMKKYGATPESRRPTLIIGPWPHSGSDPVREVGRFDYGPDAIVDLKGYAVRWLDHFLKGIDNGVEKDSPVYVFVMGPNKWYAEKDWPLPQTRWTKYFLHSDGHANTLLGDGRLTTEPPTKSGFDRFVYDPAKPTLSPWPAGEIGDGGAVDARIPEIGDEVLVYTSEPLTEDVEVTGPIEAKLFASTSAEDTDWIVHLVDVHPNGYAAILSEGVIRARSRDPENEGIFNPAKLSTIKPGEIYEYTIEFWRATGNVFSKGHRIRVDISSSYYPHYLRNLNTGADNLALVKEADAVVATQTTHHSRKYPSHIVLPVIPRRANSAN